MYKRLSEHPTKSEYAKILDETITFVEIYYMDPPTQLIQSIYAQLLDIREFVVKSQSIVDDEEIFERYTLGAYAVKNFEKGNELRERLCDIFGGAMQYEELDDK